MEALLWSAKSTDVPNWWVWWLGVLAVPILEYRLFTSMYEATPTGSMLSWLIKINSQHSFLIN